MKRKTFKGYCQTDVRKFENLEKKWNTTQTSIRKKLIRYVELYGYDLSESDMEFIREWVIESAYNVLKLNHQFDEPKQKYGNFRRGVRADVSVIHF